MHTLVTRFIAVACVLGTVYMEIVEGQIKGMKKDFRKSNKIAHFMGKRTNADLERYMDGYMEDLDSGLPFRGNTGGFPLFADRPIVPAEESMESYPYRRATPEDGVNVAHIFGRHLADSLGNIRFGYPYMVNSDVEPMEPSTFGATQESR